MKKARAQDHWRRLHESKRKNHISSIWCSNVPNFPESTVNIQGPISILTGLNGVGKSTVLNAIRVLTDRDSLSESSPLRIFNGSLEGKIIVNGEEITVGTYISDGKATSTPEILDFETTWIDTAFEIPFLIDSYRKEQNLDEAIAQVGESPYTAEDLKTISWLIGKDYTSCSVFELDDFYERNTIPYFKVSVSGSMYGMESMGIGEAALHYTFWKLRRCQENSLILIEEPETYISSRSQCHLMDLLAKTCMAKKCSGIVTTHSPSIFAKIPPDHTLILTRPNNKTRIIDCNNIKSRLLALAVDVRNEKSGLLLVEDRLAREFCKQWLRREMPSLLDSWKVVDVGSNGHIVNSLKHFPKTPEEWFRTIGIFDGDQRPTPPSIDAQFTFLPTSFAPEFILKKAILENPEEFCKSIGAQPDKFQISIARLEGTDHHDWLVELCASFEEEGISYDRFVGAGVDIWINHNSEESNKSFSHLAEISTGQTIPIKKANIQISEQGIAPSSANSNSSIPTLPPHPHPNHHAPTQETQNLPASTLGKRTLFQKIAVFLHRFSLFR